MIDPTKFLKKAENILNENLECTPLEVVLEKLQVLVERKINICEGWKDSGDRGACYAYSVEPLRKVISECEKLIDNL